MRSLSPDPSRPWGGGPGAAPGRSRAGERGRLLAVPRARRDPFPWSRSFSLPGAFSLRTGRVPLPVPPASAAACAERGRPEPAGPSREKIPSCGGILQIPIAPRSRRPSPRSSGDPGCPYPPPTPKAPLREALSPRGWPLTRKRGEGCISQPTALLPTHPPIPPSGLGKLWGKTKRVSRDSREGLSRPTGTEGVEGGRNKKEAEGTQTMKLCGGERDTASKRKSP